MNRLLAPLMLALALGGCSKSVVGFGGAELGASVAAVTSKFGPSASPCSADGAGCAWRVKDPFPALVTVYFVEKGAFRIEVTPDGDPSPDVILQALRANYGEETHTAAPSGAWESWVWTRGTREVELHRTARLFEITYSDKALSRDSNPARNTSVEKMKKSL